VKLEHNSTRASDSELLQLLLVKLNRFFILVAATLALATSANAQNIRSMGMGGALVPGKNLEPINPAFHYYEGPFEWSVPLPLGLINFFARTKDFSGGSSSFGPGLDQVLHWSTLIFNPSTARPKGVFGSSEPLSLDPGTQLSFRSPIPGGFRISVYDFDENTIGQPIAGTFSIGLGIAAQLDPLEVVINDEYAQDYAKGQFNQNGKYAMLLALGGSIGPRLDLTWGMPFELEETQWTGIVGARGAFTYNLATVEGITIWTKTPSGTTSTSLSLLASPFYKNGSSIDVSFDTGVVLQGADATVGVGVIGLIELESLNGTISGPPRNGGAYIEVPLSDQQFSLARLITVNGAYHFSVDTDSMTIPMTVYADAQIEGIFSGSPYYAAHAGLEAGFDAFTARGGIGYDNGLNIGLGGGWQISEGFGLDAALTAQQALGAKQLNFGLALGLNFKF
jgi:hypothetical protein